MSYYNNSPNAKVVRIGSSKTRSGRSYSVYCKIEFGKQPYRPGDGYLSITGVEGPYTSGNCAGGCGQIDMSPWNITHYALGWNAELERQFRKTWKAWHMKDIGDVPTDVIAFLRSLPDTDRQPAWV